MVRSGSKPYRKTKWQWWVIPNVMHFLSQINWWAFLSPFLSLFLLFLRHKGVPCMSEGGRGSITLIFLYCSSFRELNQCWFALDSISFEKNTFHWKTTRLKMCYFRLAISELLLFQAHSFLQCFPFCTDIWKEH